MGDGKMKMGSVLNEKLKSLCRINGWSFGVFWRFDQRNSMLLAVEDAYYEEQMGLVVNNMLPKVHVLGEGVVGQSAFTGKHQWVFADFRNEGLYSDDHEIRCLFSLGIKTIALIAVESQGVVQFGSTQKVGR
uniref:Transcription factor MYC/MYB N-terminal domain-containing protein n=1 Tax=Rhizophora mucronata TaxID=61149 RepID=A0A2P2Q802_RHIMU